jgi:putative addiction module killer protein
MKEIEKYVLPNGKIPYDEWFKKLDKPRQNACALRLDRCQLGLYGKHRSLVMGIVELKLKSGERMYLSEFQNKIILLLLGGNKQRQANDIRKAQEYLKDFNERNKL